MRIYTKKQIYSRIQESPAWSMTKGCHTVRVVTLIIERTFLGKFHLFKTEQFCPLRESPFYDGEYSSNNDIKACAIEEKAIAIKWLNEYISKHSQ